MSIKRFLELKDISKDFDNKKILDHLNLKFPLGEISFIQGNSGIGKTTLLRILGGLTPADSGHILWPKGFVPQLRMQFQEDRLIENLSALANIKLLSKAPDQDINNALAALALKNEEQPVREFSGGMRRRVSLARAVLSEHNVLLLDEPFASLDTEAKNLAYAFILEQHQLKQDTVLIVTHQLPETVKEHEEQINLFQLESFEL